jgi:acetylornithine deacetylase
MVRRPSYTGSHGEGALARYLADRARGLGMEPVLEEVDEGRSNLVIRQPGSGGGRSLLFDGHLDTNPAVLGWTEDPFGGVVKDGCIYGVGVCNMKAADAAYLAALDAVRRSGVELRGDVTIALVVGEQQGGVGTLALLERGWRADYFIDGEPVDNSLLTMHAGVLPFRINTYGRMRHVSKQAEGVSAIDKAYAVIEGLKKLRFSGPDDPEYVGLRRVNVAAIRGGLGKEYLDWRPGLVPDYCTIVVDVRYGPGQSEESVFADVRQMLDRLQRDDADLRADIEPWGVERRRMPFFIVEPDQPIVRIVAEAHRRVTGQEPRVGPVEPYKFYGTDAAHLSRAGISGVVYGPGGKHTTSPNECMEVDDLVTAARVYALAIVDVCS